MNQAVPDMIGSHWTKSVISFNYVASNIKFMEPHTQSVDHNATNNNVCPKAILNYKYIPMR